MAHREQLDRLRSERRILQCSVVRPGPTGQKQKPLTVWYAPARWEAIPLFCVGCAKIGSPGVFSRPLVTFLNSRSDRRADGSDWTYQPAPPA